MKRVLIYLCFCLFLTSPTFAQVEVVQQAKADLVTSGADLSGSCGAFKITKLVAWRLKSTGAGLLDKPSGNNCDGFAVDIVMYPDGKIVDMLSDSGGANGPAWQVGAPVDPARYRPAIDPGTVVTPPPPPPGPDYGAQIANLQRQVNDVMKMLDFDANVLKTLSEKQQEVSDKVDGLRILTNQLIARPVVASCSASFAGIPIHCKINNFSQ